MWEQGAAKWGFSPVVAGFYPKQAGQDEALGWVPHAHTLLQGHLGEDGSGLQCVPLGHRLRGAGEVAEGAFAAIAAALQGPRGAGGCGAEQG